MNLKFTFLFFLLSFVAIAQDDTKKYAFDFNEDGTPDELIVTYFIGMLDYASYTDGATKVQYRLPFQRQETKHSLIKVTPIPAYFMNPAGEKALPKIDSLMFSIPTTNKAELSMLWLLDNYITKTTLTNKYFSSYSTFQPTWVKQKPRLPKNYRLLISDTLLLKGLYDAHHVKDTNLNAYVTYLGKYHTSAISLDRNDVNAVYPIRLDSAKNFQLFQSAHGIYIKKDSLYSWVFVSDGALYNNIQKLEWESIIDVKTYHDYIIVLNQPYPAIQNNLFIVDWKRGKIVELNRQFLLSKYPDVRYMENIQVTEDYLIIFAKNKPSSYDLHEIKIDLREVLEEMMKL
ncbi:MAG: hypothetical protein NT150_09075 [Bacteroidetes bacterium]|nr:hypothetical protein [Bacteroidota bacterium]